MILKGKYNRKKLLSKEYIWFKVIVMDIEIVLKQIRTWAAENGVSQMVQLDISPEGKIKASRTVHYRSEKDLKADHVSVDWQSKN